MSKPIATPLPQDLPVGRAVELVNIPRKGWCVLTLEIQGDKVISKHVYSGPDELAKANQNALLAFAKMLTSTPRN